MKLSILIPVYNERYLVSEMIRRVLNAPLPADLDRELVIVDDGSTDGSREIIETLAAQHPEQIRFFPQEQNRGKGHAIRTAIAQATGDFGIFQDADLEYDPTDYARIMAPLLGGQADVVFGSRFLSGERKRVLYFWHSIGNQLLTTLSNMFTDLNLTDMETCYKAFRMKVLKTIPLRSNGFGLEPEITAKVAKRGLRIYEVPINYDGRTYAEGKKITWKDGLKALYVVIKFWLIDDLYKKSSGEALLTNLARTHKFNAWLAARLRPLLGHRVLEIGAGLGNLTVQLGPRDRYIASDIEDAQLEVLHNLALHRSNLEVAKIDAQKASDFAPYAEDIDTVISLNTLEHLPDEKEALKNFWTVLKPEGKVIVLVPQGPWLFSPMDETLKHRKRYSKQELLAAMVEAGFEVEQSFHFNRIGVLGWLLHGTLLRRKRMAKIQLKAYDALVWVWRLTDWMLPWHGLSLVAVGRKPQAGSSTS